MFTVCSPGSLVGVTSEQEWLERALAAAPPLTGEQRAKLAELLRPVREARAERLREAAQRGEGDGESE